MNRLYNEYQSNFGFGQFLDIFYLFGPVFANALTWALIDTPIIQKGGIFAAAAKIWGPSI
ncbi:MAG: hypothetical protein CM15mP8_3720 [Methanobacteriota archaeon]|nr:MAG: hypothetical protein CM15mP8_3720 [Euryarchaeota archaeon]